jgi:hypothetical protein
MRAAPLLFVIAGCTPTEVYDHADVGGEILAVRVEIDAGDVTVSATDASTVRVDRTLRGAAGLSSRRYVEAGILRVEARCETLLPCGADVDLAVPHGLPVDIRTGDGDVHLYGLDSDLSVEVGDGDVDGDGLLATTVRVQAGWGDATLRFDARPVDVAVSVGVGDVRLDVPDGGYRFDVAGLGREHIDGLDADPHGPRLYVRTASGRATLARQAEEADASR